MNARTMWWTIAACVALVIAAVWYRDVHTANESADDQQPAPHGSKPMGPPPAGAQLATFGNGCFWCTEAIFQQLKGVYSVTSGYSGGSVANPTYKQVCSGATGHAEVIQIVYDANEISFVDLLEVFWKTHDPTTLNRQGNDVGTQYRSVIFAHDAEQKLLAQEYKAKLDASGAFSAPIVTEIAPFEKFYPAEAYHQNFFVDNPRQQYCARLIRPKVEKFQMVFKNKLRSSKGN